MIRLTLALLLTAALPAQAPLPYAPTEPGSWQALYWTGQEYVVGVHNNRTIAAKIDREGASPVLRYVGEFDDLDGGGATTITTGPWTCSCHGLQHTVSTEVSDRYEESDLQKHDRKLEKVLQRHPPRTPNPAPLPPETGTPTPKAPKPPDQRTTGGLKLRGGDRGVTLGEWKRPFLSHLIERDERVFAGRTCHGAPRIP